VETPGRALPLVPVWPDITCVTCGAAARWKIVVERQVGLAEVGCAKG
jgi:hypothetical protein